MLGLYTGYLWCFLSYLFDMTSRIFYNDPAGIERLSGIAVELCPLLRQLSGRPLVMQPSRNSPARSTPLQVDCANRTGSEAVSTRIRASGGLHFCWGANPNLAVSRTTAVTLRHSEVVPFPLFGAEEHLHTFNQSLTYLRTVLLTSFGECSCT